MKTNGLRALARGMLVLSLLTGWTPALAQSGGGPGDDPVDPPGERAGLARTIWMPLVVKGGQGVNHPPAVPSTPAPANGAAGVPINTVVRWSGGDPDGDAVAYDLYLEAGDATPDVRVMDNNTARQHSPGPLANNTTYYWQVTAVDEHGLAATGPVWRFTTVAAPPNHVPNTPASPTPANGAVNQGLDTNISWDGGDSDGDTVTYDVYFEAGDTTPDVLVSDNQAGRSYDPGALLDAATYYWQITATDEHGLSTTGPVWSFSTVALPNHAPHTPGSPFPADGALGQAVGFLNLKWTGGDPDGDAVTYDVYLEAGAAYPDVLVSDGQAALTYTPGPLIGYTSYSWRIIATDEHGATAAGPTWHFITTRLDPDYRPAAAAPGGEHTCALTESGGVRCWGNNLNGQLGDGSYTPRTRPVDVIGLDTGVVAITAGYNHSCALMSTGGVRCWGSNVYGQLGDNTDLDRNTPVAVSGLSSGVLAIDAKNYHTCALMSTGAVRCWGQNNYGQLGDGTTDDRDQPVTVSGLSGVTAISAGEEHSCALGAGAVRCWGRNNQGQLGDSSTTDRHTPVTVTGLSGVAAVKAGGNFTCALTAAGVVRCWGDNVFGQLGNGGSPADSHTPVDVTGLGDSVDALAVGFLHACAIRDGAVSCWGSNDWSQLGDGTMISKDEPVAVIRMAGAESIAAGAFHTCAEIADGGLQCWGWNQDSHLGDDTPTTREYPVYVIGFILAAETFSSGGAHTCVKTEVGGVRCWGDNTYGQLGDGGTGNHYVPVPVIGLSGVVQVAAGNTHTCALLDDDTVRCWGKNNYGQLGDSTTTHRSAPVTVTGLASGPMGISAGLNHSCAVFASGTAQCWGWNNEGQLGDGTTTDRWTPVNVSGLTIAGSVAAGMHHTCARTTTHGARCWGDNFYGQLGDDSTIDRHTQVAVTGLASGVYSITAGFYHSCARITGGDVRCWGNNSLGQLGDETTINSDIPVDVHNLPGCALIDAGGVHTCTASGDGEVACWGNNNFGQLGDGTTTQRTSPVAALGIPGPARSISAGSYHTCVLAANGVLLCTGSNLYGQLGQDTYGSLTNSTVFIPVHGFRIE